MMHPRRREWLLFDDRGETWAAQSPELQRRLHCVQDDDVPTGLVRNLGFVAGRTLSNNAALRLHGELVSDVALAAAFYWLSDCRPARVLIDFVEPSRPAEVCTSAEAAIARLVDLTRGRDFNRHVAEQPCSINDLPAGSPLRGLLGLWASNSGGFNEEAYFEYAARRLLKRFLVVRQNLANALVIDRIGDGLRVPEREWFKSALGRPIEEQPDTPYWRWVARVQRAALQTNNPVLSDIDASIYWPSRGRVRRRYRRLLLPCTTREGTRLLFSANSSESRIALRGQVA
ncbi:MAG: hypothetical protein J2P50_06560 [Hyphomicrobiaceae bacterium]|nr:hypothetical protein [Hyphomicrobiaceae bacterium]